MLFSIAKTKKLVSWMMFLSTLTVVLVSLTSVVFPALVLRSLGGFEDHTGINPFETGIWTYPFLITNLTSLFFVILYLKNKLPSKIRKPLRFIFYYEVSKQVAFLLVIIMLGIYIVFSVNEIFDDRFDPDYYERVKSWLENWTIVDLNYGGIWYQLQLFFLTSSMKIFGSYEAIPFITSIVLPVLTYLIVTEISKKRLAGIVSMAIVLQSGIFLMYDTSVSYPNFWIVFYLLSLYLIYKKDFLSPISYVLAVLSKPLVAPFLPMSLFFLYRSSISKRNKIKILSYYATIVILGIILLSIMHEILSENGKFSSHDFWGGFAALSYELRLDGLVLLFLLPLTIGLFIVSRRGVLHADSIMFLIMGMLLSAPFVQGFSDSINVPYRFVPLIVFFAIGVGLLLSRKA